MERESPQQHEEPKRHEEIIRLFISLPAYALAERSFIAELLVRINAAFVGKIRVETIGQTEPGSEQPALTAADCDAVVALIRPRLATDVTPSGAATLGDANQGSVSGVLSAVRGRKADAGLPDIYIFRYADPNDIDADWEGRKQVFDSWFNARGGKVLSFDDFFAPTEFIAKLEHRLRSWLARLGYDVSDDAGLATGNENIQAAPSEIPADDLRSEAADPGIEALDAERLDIPQHKETHPDTDGPTTDSAASIDIGDSADQEPVAASNDLAGVHEEIVDHANLSEAEISENRSDKGTSADIEISVTDAAIAVGADDLRVQESHSESDHVSEADDDILGRSISAPETTAEMDTAIGGLDSAKTAETDVSASPQIEDEKAAEKPGVIAAAEIADDDKSEVSPRLRGRKAWRKSSKARKIDDAVLDAEPIPALDAGLATEERPDAGIESSTKIAVMKSDTISENPGTIDTETIVPEPADAGPGTEISTGAGRDETIDAVAETSSVATDEETVIASEPIPEILPLSQKPASAAATDEPLHPLAPVVTTSSPDIVAFATAFVEAERRHEELDAKYRALEAEANDVASEASQQVREAQAHAEVVRRKSRRIAWGAAAAAIVILAVVGVEWRKAAIRRDRAEQHLATAADRAGTLVSELAKKSQQPSGAGEAANNDALDKARSLLGDLAAASKFDPVERKNSADSLMASADNLLKEGKLDDGLKAATQARDILQTLSTAEPDQPDWLDRLAQSDSTIGELYFLQKDIDDALGSFREALAIRHTLALKDPGDPARQKALASAERRTGDMQLEKSRLDDALAVYRDAQAIDKTFVQNSPDAPDAQQSLIEIDDVIGDTLTARNNLDDALGVYEEELTLAQHMAQTAPGEQKWQRAAALADNKVGDVLLAKQRIDDAIAAYREGLAIVKALAAKEPASKDWQSMSATSQERIGDALAAETHSESALSAYNEALATVTALAAKEPGNGEWQRGISETQLRIGWILFKQGKIDASIAAHRESLAVVKAMIAKEPGNTRWRRDLMLDDGKIAQLLMAQGNHANALPIYQEALAIAKEMGPKDPGNTEWQNTRAVVDSNVGRLLMESGKQDEALIDYRDARNTAEALALKDPASVDWQTGLVIAYYNLAEAGEDTNANLLRASEILKRLDAAGALPADKKMLIGKIDEELDNSTRQVKRR